MDDVDRRSTTQSVEPGSMRILVCIDGSPDADRALAWALHEASLHSARLTVLHAFRSREFAGPFARDASLDKERAEALADVEQALARLTGDTRPPDVEIETAAVMGRGAADAILRHRGEADLIVVGSRGLGGFPGLLLGSVSQQVAAHADVPVAVTPRGGETPVTLEDDDTRSVVVGVDGSPTSMRALRWAVDEARVRSVPLTAIYVYRSLRTGAPFDAFVSIEREQLDQLEAQAAQTARAKLDSLLAGAADYEGVQLDGRVIAGSPAKTLTFDAADETTLLVVGSRGHGGFAGLLLGSVTQQCLHHARGPVVVTPAER